MSDIRDLNPGVRVDRGDRRIVKALRGGLIGLGILVLFLAAFALVEAGWVAWATIGIVFAGAAAVALVVMLVIVLAS